MSNMIYSGYTPMHRGEKFVLDSNSRANEFVPISFKNNERIFLEKQEESEIWSAEEDSKESEEENLLLTERAENILKEAREEAERILVEAKADAQAQAEALREAARNSGYAAGYEKGQEDVRQLEIELQEQIEEAKRDYQEKVLQLEPMFAELTIQMVEKLTGAVVKSKKDVVLHLMEKALLNNESNSQRYVIHVSGEDFAVVDAKKKQLHMLLRQGAVLEIVEDAGLTRNQCLIETESKMIDCSLDVQLENVKASLKELAEN